MDDIQQQITFLYVRDLERSADFYRDILGFPLVLDQGGCRIYGTGRGYLGVCEDPGKAEEGRGKNSVIITFVTGAVDGWYQRIQESGQSLNSRPEYSEEYQIYHFFVRDPDGYILEFQEFLDPRWKES